MATTFKTPGVYVQEIPTLGSSVAGVPTAITGFAGYTEKAILPDGTPATMVPVRITSLLEYQQIFGGPFHETYTVTLSGSVTGTNTIAVAPTSKGTVPNQTLSSYILFYQVQMFYANGGGACYISSVGDYTSTISATDLNAGIDLGVDPTTGGPVKLASHDKWLFGGQTGFNDRISPDYSFRVGVAFYDFSNVQGQVSSACTVSTCGRRSRSTSHGPPAPARSLSSRASSASVYP